MFKSARIKLTLWYLAIMMGVSVIFSGIIYRISINEVMRFERQQRVRIQQGLGDWVVLRGPGPVFMTNTELVEEAKRRILLGLGMVNAAVLVAAGGLGYMLAGRTLSPIAEMVEEQSRFVSDASHELRTPLTSLKSGFEVFLRDPKAKLNEAKTLIQVSVDDVNKLQKLTDSLLKLARYEQSSRGEQWEKFNVKKMVEEAVMKVEKLAQGKQISLDVSVGEIQLTGNREKLREVVVILLDNAIKYSELGDKVTIKGKKRDGTVELVISDTGMGIEKKDLPHIFERFYRSDAARSRTGGGGGYGLGLAIAKKTVEEHGGSIEVTSQVGRGTIVKVKVPVKAYKLFS